MAPVQGLWDTKHVQQQSAHDHSQANELHRCCFVDHTLPRQPVDEQFVHAEMWSITLPVPEKCMQNERPEAGAHLQLCRTQEHSNVQYSWFDDSTEDEKCMMELRIEARIHGTGRFLSHGVAEESPQRSALERSSMQLFNLSSQKQRIQKQYEQHGWVTTEHSRQKPERKTPTISKPGQFRPHHRHRDSRSNGTTDNLSKAFAQPTAVMIRNIASKLGHADMIQMLNGMGFQDKFDIVFLPLNTTRNANLGYVFVSFIELQHVQEFTELVHQNGSSLGRSDTEAPFEVTSIQAHGRANLLRHLRRHRAAMRHCVAS